MGKTIGIDLGTTNTVVAVLQDGRPKVLEDDKGYKVLPSCVAWKGDSRYIVGQPAKNLILTQPDRTVYAVKRLVGRRYDDPAVVQAMKRMAYRIDPAPDGTTQVLLGDVVLTPVEVSSIILQVARSIAEKHLGEPVSQAVITVPAYFNHAQRAATMEAAQAAGLEVDRLLNEPTSAALAYGYRRDIEKTLCIFDLGGGTFDVSVLNMSQGVYEILSTMGDTFLGGEDFDFAVVEYLADEFQRKHHVDLRGDPTAVQRLKDAAERAKCELSFTDRATVLVPQIASGKNLEQVLTRATLERLVNELVMRTVDITREAVSSAGLQLGDVDDVILVGGQTRMPRVREVISGLFGREPSRSVHPEEVVAIGAAVHAESLDDPEVAKTLLIDVTPFDLGIDAAGGFFSPIIERNSKIPATHTRTFTTVSDNQEKVRITVRQGESRQAQENEFLGEFVLTGLRPAPRMTPKLDVTFRIDANGMLHVTATERATGERQQIVVRNYAEVAATPGSGPEEPERAVAAEAPVATEPTSPAEAGLLGRLLGRGRKKKKSKKDAAPPAAEAVAASADEVPAVEMPRIELPASAPEPASVAPESLELAPEPESVEPGGLASLDPDGDDVFALPPDDDEVFALPPEEDELFAAPPDDDDFDDADPFDDAEPRSVEPLSMGALEPVEDPVTAGDLLADDDVDPFAALDDDDLEGGDDLLGYLPPPEPEPEPESVADHATEAPPEPAPPSKTKKMKVGGDRKRKPAKLKINYRKPEIFVRESRKNLDAGFTFIKTSKPLPTGRECVFLVSAPGLDEPLTFEGVVIWSSRDEEIQLEGDEGMRIEYRMSPSQRSAVEDAVTRLG